MRNSNYAICRNISRKVELANALRLCYKTLVARTALSTAQRFVGVVPQKSLGMITRVIGERLAVYKINVMHSSYNIKKQQLLRGELPVSETAEELFVYGYQLDENGAHEHADMVYRDVVSALEEVHQLRGQEVSCAEIANCAFVHGKNLYSLGRKRQARASFRQAVDKLENQVAFGVAGDVVALYATSLRWLALSQFQTGDREKGRETFRRSIAAYRGLVLFGREERDRVSAKKALRSIARIYRKLGIEDDVQAPVPRERLQ